MKTRYLISLDSVITVTMTEVVEQQPIIKKTKLDPGYILYIYILTYIIYKKKQNRKDEKAFRNYKDSERYFF